MTRRVNVQILMILIHRHIYCEVQPNVMPHAQKSTTTDASRTNHANPDPDYAETRGKKSHFNVRIHKIAEWYAIISLWQAESIKAAMIHKIKRVHQQTFSVRAIIK